MVSVIICSASAQQRERVCKNIAETIGVEHEFIIHDNTQENRLGICQAYNICASKAKYDCLCFVHEDVEFLTKGWGRELTVQANKDFTGVIGLAGGTVVTQTPLAWGDLGDPYIRVHIMHGRKRLWSENPAGETFSRVITLDGVLLFCKKSVWDNVRFNDADFKGFHTYDLDFSFHASKSYRNYVYHGLDLIHNSKGNFTKEWLDSTTLFYTKNAKALPASVEKLDDSEMANINENALYQHIRRYTLKLEDKDVCKKKLEEFRKKYPLSKHNLILLTKYTTHKLLGI